MVLANQLKGFLNLAGGETEGRLLVINVGCRAFSIDQLTGSLQKPVKMGDTPSGEWLPFPRIRQKEQYFFVVS